MRVLLAALLALAACAKHPVKTDGPQTFDIAVTNKGFEPARISVAPGQQVVLRITRKVAETCADAVDVQGDPVRHMLPLDAPVEVRATAPASGELAFACPMKMVRGAIAVVGQ
jgi:plastocyanin domain-containing protein